ncbi:hypothetical protein CIG19_11615 [Enterobacterales bacterium CwR94]|nr:hypothetical protein CIG19_11615 [Enterobacterales bacterium CwR94]
MLPLLRRWKLSPLSHYQRLFMLVSLINLAGVGYGLYVGEWWHRHAINLQSLAHMALANLLVTVLIRQQYIINALFKLIWRTPLHWPLGVRRHLAKVYHFGGLHSGCATFATLWMIAFAGSVVWHHTHHLPGVSALLVALNLSLALLLALVCVMALPQVRAKYHNQFEHTHRYVGWAALLLSWAQVICFVHVNHTALLSAPAFWGLVLITGSVIMPWLHLKRVPVSVTRPSEHAVFLEFHLPRAPFVGSSFAISRQPLGEWHAFANLPLLAATGCRMLISRAGDWTGEFIDNPPTHVWFKGIPTPGVGSVNKLFHSVVFVATGSGIGPLLPHLVGNARPCRLIWSTRNPRMTYGEAFVDELLRIVPDVVIWDTDAHGKPDLLALTWQEAERIQAEAVVCIANRSLTDYVVEGCEARGRPAYGAIWDS